MTSELNYQRITALQEENAALRARLERVEAVLSDCTEPNAPSMYESTTDWHSFFHDLGAWQLAQRIREALEADE